MVKDVLKPVMGVVFTFMRAFTEKFEAHAVQGKALPADSSSDTAYDSDGDAMGLDIVVRAGACLHCASAIGGTTHTNVVFSTGGRAAGILRHHGFINGEKLSLPGKSSRQPVAVQRNLIGLLSSHAHSTHCATAQGQPQVGRVLHHRVDANHSRPS